MQRLFSTFANGWPGFGLLIQRLVLGLALLYHGVAFLSGIYTAEPLMLELVGCVLGLLVLLGLWTPAAGALVAVVQVWIAFTGTGDSKMAVVLAVLGGTLSMIGPGAWSLDARLFGRKYIAG